MEKIIDKIIEGVVVFSGKFFFAGFVVVVGFKIIKITIKNIRKGKAFNKLEKSSQTFIASILNIVLKSLIVITAIAIVGIPMTSIVAVIGSAGLALGLALQGGLSNIAGGVMLMLFKPFKVGDYIDVGSESGTVKEINIFHTVLETIDKKYVVLPNGNLSNSVVVNYSSTKERKLDLKFSVDYSSDIEKVKKILMNIALNNKYLINKKEEDILVALTEHSDSALIFTFRMLVKTEDYWPARYEILETVKKEFDKNKIIIPFPQLDVHLDK